MSISPDELRAAIGEIADEVSEQDVPPLALPAAARVRPFAARPLLFKTARPLRGSRRLAALAAAAAVIAVIATSVSLVGGPRAPQPARERQAGVEAGSAKGLGGVPPYYLALVPFGKPLSSGSRMEAQVRATATGKILAVVHPPRPFRTLTVISGAADDRTFVLAAQKTPYPLSQRVKFFLARFNPARRRVAVTPLRIPELPASDDLMGLTLSPDGADLAVAVSMAPSAGQAAEISIYSLTTGQVTKWQHAPGATCTQNDDPGCMSWSSGTLAFNWSGTPDMQGLWLLNTGTPGGDLLFDSRLAVFAGPSPFKGWHWNGDGLLTADGKKIVMVMWKDIDARGSNLRMELQTFSASTGKLLQRLYPIRGGHGQGECLEWSNPSGSVLVISAPVRGTTANVFGVLKGGRFTPLPGAPPPNPQVQSLTF